MAAVEVLRTALRKIISHYKDTYELINEKKKSYKDSLKIIELFELVQDNLQIIYDHLGMILEREKSFKDRSNFDPRGTWGVVTRILNRLIQRIKKNINAFPPFKSPERSYSFSLRRKENLIVQKLNEISENVQYASKCVVRLVITTEHGSLIDETSLKDFLESTYSYPFWYTVCSFMHNKPFSISHILFL